MYAITSVTCFATLDKQTVAESDEDSSTRLVPLSEAGVGATEASWSRQEETGHKRWITSTHEAKQPLML